MKPEKMENAPSSILFNSADLYTDGSIFFLENI